MNTCVLPRCALEAAGFYRERLGADLGLELLPMFDIPDFEDDLKRNLDLYAGGPLTFHEPVFGVEHTAPRGSAAWEEGMYHLRLTKRYASILRPSSMAFHLNNCPIPPEDRERALKTALENLEEEREMFPGVRILVENTGLKADGTQLADQEEFTGLCLAHGFPVLVDVGHANMNGWDVPKLIEDLKDLIAEYHLHNNDGRSDQHNRLRDGTLDMEAVVRAIDRFTPDAKRVIEYTRPAYHGEPVLEDIRYLQSLSRPGAADASR